MKKEKDEDKKKNIKRKKIVKIILSIICIIVLVFLIFISRRIILINNHLKQVEIYNLNENKYKKITSYTQTGLRITESYQKGNITKVKADFEDNRKAIFYTDKSKDEALMLVEKDDKKVAYISNIKNSLQINADAYSSIGTKEFWNNFMQALMIKSISTENCNNQECYLIEAWYGGKSWINKETMLPTRDINAINYLVEKDTEVTQVIDTKYSVNTVTDKDVIKPDLTGYQIINQ